MLSQGGEHRRSRAVSPDRFLRKQANLGELLVDVASGLYLLFSSRLSLLDACFIHHYCYPFLVLASSIILTEAQSVRRICALSAS